MTSTFAPSTTPDTRRTATTQPTTARRVGHILSILTNAVMLWAAYQLLDWGWPNFLTSDFAQVLGILTLSFLVGMVASATFLFRDRGRFRALADLVTGSIGIAVLLRLWSVFPFDFSVYEQDWSWLVTLLIILGIVGTSIGLVVSVVRLVRPDEPRSAG